MMKLTRNNDGELTSTHQAAHISHMSRTEKLDEAMGNPSHVGLESRLCDKPAHVPGVELSQELTIQDSSSTFASPPMNPVELIALAREVGKAIRRGGYTYFPDGRVTTRIFNGSKREVLVNLSTIRTRTYLPYVASKPSARECTEDTECGESSPAVSVRTPTTTGEPQGAPATPIVVQDATPEAQPVDTLPLTPQAVQHSPPASISAYSLLQSSPSELMLTTSPMSLTDELPSSHRRCVIIAESWQEGEMGPVPSVDTVVTVPTSPVDLPLLSSYPIEPPAVEKLIFKHEPYRFPPILRHVARHVISTPSSCSLSSAPYQSPDDTPKPGLWSRILQVLSCGIIVKFVKYIQELVSRNYRRQEDPPVGGLGIIPAIASETLSHTTQRTTQKLLSLNRVVRLFVR